MKILIDDYYERIVLFNKTIYTKNQLFSIYINSLKQSKYDINKTIDTLINKYNFIKVDKSNNDNIYDFCIDTDINIIYKLIL